MNQPPLSALACQNKTQPLKTCQWFNWSKLNLPMSNSWFEMFSEICLLHHWGTSSRQRKTEIERRKSVHTVQKGGKKPWITRLPVCCKEGGGGIFCFATVRQLRPVQYSTQSAHGGGVLSCTESTPVLEGSHYIVFTIVCNWGKKKKRGGSKRRRRKPMSLCWIDSAGNWSSDHLSLPALQDLFTPSNSGATSSAEPFFSSFFCQMPDSHTAVFLRPANSDTRATPDDESWRQSKLHEYWCGG